MIFLVILDCKEKGLKESTRLCSKYLNQIGHRAFVGNLTNNNFNNLIEEFEDSITNNNSISIFRMKKDNYKLVKHLGHTERLDENGLYAFKLKDEVIMDKYKKESTAICYKALKEVVAISGYFHDLGKGNAAFQNMLNASRKIDNKKLCKKFLFNEDLENEQIAGEDNKWFNLIRHEVISYLILKNIIKNGFEKDGVKHDFNDSNFFEVLSNKDTLEELFESVLSKRESSILDEFEKYILSRKSDGVNKTEKEIKLDENLKQIFNDIYCENNNVKNFFSSDKFFINLILFLTLTHHRLPEKTNEISNDLGEMVLSTYVNEKYFDYYKYYFKIFLTCHKKDDNEFLHSKNWNTLVTESCLKLNNLIKENKNLNNIETKESIFEYTINHARLSLIISDYLESKEKNVASTEREREIIKNNISIANIETFGNSYDSEGKKNLKPADSVTEHLMKVGKGSYNIIPDILIDSYKNTNHYSFITKKDRDNFIAEKEKEYSENKKIGNLERFNWQYDTMNELKMEKYRNKPFFGISVAGTGSGKTNANFLTMMALDDNPRFTCGLGLKTLTLQSYNAYQENEEIKDATALFVGSSLDSELEKQDSTKTIEINETESGSSTEKLMDNDHFKIFEIKKTDNFYKFDENKDYKDWFKILDKKAQRLIHAPIAVMTIDNIAKGVQHGRGHNTLNMNRTMTSDLILDEIDDYSLNDMATIMKLVYLTGLSGRKVLLSSATVNEVIVHTLFDAYISGLKKRAIFFEKEFEFGCGLISQYSEINKFEFYKSNDDVDFKKTYSQFLDNLESTIKDEKNIVNITKTQRNKIEFVDLQKNNNNICIENNSFKNILEKSLDYSQKFYTKIKTNEIEKNLSIGFVRFNNIKYSQKFCKYILKTLDSSLDTKILVLNYHSKMMGIDRYLTEDFLNNLLKRKQVSNDMYSIENFPNLKEHILYEKIKEFKEKNIVVLVSSTNILEVGRDHDYDWAILEFQNTKSLIQSMGRVRRHRTIESNEPNIAIMTDHLKVLNDNNSILKGYTKFGILDNDQYEIFKFIDQKKLDVGNNCYNNFFSSFDFEPIKTKKSRFNLKKENPVDCFKPKEVVNINNLSNINTLRLSKLNYTENRALKTEQLRLIESFTNIDFKLSLDGFNFYRSILKTSNIHSYLDNVTIRINGTYTKKFQFRNGIYKNKTFTLKFYNKNSKSFNLNNLHDYYKLKRISAETFIKKDLYEKEILFESLKIENNNDFLLNVIYPNKTILHEEIKNRFNNLNKYELYNYLFTFSFVVIDNSSLTNESNYLFNLGLFNDKK